MADHDMHGPEELTYSAPQTADAALEEVAAAEAIKSLEHLIQRGKERGRVTQEEIMQLVPQPEDNVDRLEEIYDALSKAGITIIDELTDDGALDVDPYRRGRRSARSIRPRRRRRRAHVPV